MSEKKEYIERGALKDKFRIPDRESVFNLVIAKTPTIEAANIATDMIIEIAGALRDAVDNEPVADVEPVVRGEWMWKTTKEAEAFAPLGIVLGTENYICSECKKYLHRESMRNPLPKYCDECGAKMGLPGKERER